MERDYPLNPSRTFQPRSGAAPRHPEWFYVYDERVGILTQGRREPTEFEDELAVRDATEHCLRSLPFRKA